MRCLSMFEDFQEWIEIIRAALDHAVQALSALGRPRGVAKPRLADGGHHSVFRNFLQEMQGLLKNLSLSLCDDPVVPERDLIGEMPRAAIDISGGFESDISIHQEWIVHRFGHHAEE